MLIVAAEVWFALERFFRWYFLFPGDKVPGKRGNFYICYCYVLDSYGTIAIL